MTKMFSLWRRLIIYINKVEHLFDDWKDIQP